MPKFRERFESKMTEWINSSKSETEVFPFEYDRLRAFLWSRSEARKAEELGKISQCLEAQISEYLAMINTMRCFAYEKAVVVVV